MIRSLIDIVISSFIYAEVIQKGFLDFPISLRKAASGQKFVEKALILKVCVETSERVIGRGANNGYLHASSMIQIDPSFLFTQSLISVALKVFLSISKKVFESCSPTTPIASSSTDPGLILQSYLASLSPSSLCFPFFSRKRECPLRESCSNRSGVSKDSFRLMGLLFQSQSWIVLEE